MLQNQNDLEQEHNCQVGEKERKEDTVKTTSERSTNPKCEILLNNFLIKKRRFSVLLNGDRIIWEALRKGKSESCRIKENLENDSATSRAKQAPCNDSNALNSVLHISDIIGITQGDCETAATTSNVSTGGQFLIIHFAKRINKSVTDCNRWRVRSISLYNADVNIIQQWYNTINQRLELQWRIRRLLVFINPFGGRQKGLKIYERYCKPLFRLACIDASCIISQRPNQIHDILISHDLSIYDAVCCVGGDGTVAEVINGLLFREIRDKGLDIRLPELLPKPRLPMGVIPAGSTDTVAYSLHGTADIETAAIHLVLGRRRGLDVCSVKNSEGLLRFCASVLSYGYLGDVAAKSEKYRWMGTKRYEYAGIKTFLKNRGYEAEIKLLLSTSENVDNIDNSSTNEKEEKNCYFNCPHCAKAVANESSIQQNNDQISNNVDDMGKETAIATRDYLNNKTETKTYHIGTLTNKRYIQSKARQLDDHSGGNISSTCDDARVDRNLNYGKEEPYDETIAVDGRSQRSVQNNDKEADHAFTNLTNAQTKSSLQWKTIRGSFFMIIGANITCACSRSPNGISRYNHLSDGYLDLILVRKTSLWNNVRFLMNTMGQNGDIRNLPFVEVYRTRKFHFQNPRLIQDVQSLSGSSQPITATEYDVTSDGNHKASRWNCDGEVVNDLDVIMSSHCQLIDVFMRGPYPYTKNSTNERQNNSLFCCCHAVSK